LQRPPIAASTSAGKYGQIYGDHPPNLRPSKADFEGRVNDWYQRVFFWIFGFERWTIVARRAFSQ
jgi:hypothetical protein